MTRNRPIDEAVARDAVQDLEDPPGPMDGDWAQRERAAKGLPPPDPDGGEPPKADAEIINPDTTPAEGP